MGANVAGSDALALLDAIARCNRLRREDDDSPDKGGWVDHIRNSTHVTQTERPLVPPIPCIKSYHESESSQLMGSGQTLCQKELRSKRCARWTCATRLVGSTSTVKRGDFRHLWKNLDGRYVDAWTHQGPGASTATIQFLVASQSKSKRIPRRIRSLLSIPVDLDNSSSGRRQRSRL